MLRAPIPAALPTRHSSSPSPPCPSSGCKSPLHVPSAAFTNNNNNELNDNELDGYRAPSGLQPPEAALPRTDLGRERLCSEKCSYSITSFYDGEPSTPPLVQATFSSFRDDSSLSSVDINSNSVLREISPDSDISKSQLSGYSESPLRTKSSNTSPSSNITMGSIVDVPNCLIQKNTGRPARLSRRSSFRKLRDTSLQSLMRPSVVGPSQSTGAINSHQQQKWVEEFRLLETELPKFIARTGTHKANVLRLSLLPFLRAQKGELATIPTFERQRRLHLFQRWWTSILSSLTGKRSISRADISAFLEAISGLMSRREWRDQLDYNNSMRKSAEVNTRPSSKQENQIYQFSVMYQNSLIDTLAYAISKVSGRALPVSFSAFTGKVLAYSFYYSSLTASPLLYLLKVDQKDIDRVLNIALSEEHEKKIFRDTVQMICTDLNSDVQRLIGLTTALDPHHKPSVPAKLQSIYDDGWTIRWTSRDSDIFTSFLKHYYMLSFDVLPDISSPSTLLAAPGMVLLQAYILRLLDDTVHRPTKSLDSTIRPPAIAPSASPSRLSGRISQLPSTTRNVRSRWDPNTSLNESMPRTSCRGPSKQLYELKLFRLMQELLYCDDSCMRYSEPTGRLFHHLLEAVVIRTKLYDVEACIALCDLSEEYLATLCLDDSSRNVVNWEFWRQVLDRMLSSNNHFIELRALAFLFNIWGQISVHDSENENEAGNLRLIFTKWILSLKTWTYFFCHWSPLVRSYYLRLLCWRVGRVESLTPSAQDIRIQRMILNRFYTAYDFAKKMESQAAPSIVNPPCYTPLTPLAGRILTISRNTPAIGRPMSRMSAPLCSVIFPSFQDDVLSANGKDTGFNPPCLRRVDCFEVYDDMLYTHSKRIQTPTKEDQRYSQRSNHPWQSSSPSFSESLATVDSLSQGFSDSSKISEEVTSNGPNWSPSSFMKGLKNVFGISSSRSPSPVAELPSPRQIDGEGIKQSKDYRDSRATISASSSSTCVSALTPPSLVSDTSSNSGPDYDDIRLQNGRFTPTLSLNREERVLETLDMDPDGEAEMEIPMPKPNLSRRLSKRVSFSLLPLGNRKPDATIGRRSSSLQDGGAPRTLSSRASADDLSRLRKQQQQAVCKPRSLSRSISSNALSQRTVSGTSDDCSENGDFVRSPFAKRDKLRMKRPLFKFVMCPSNFGQFSVAGYSGNPILAALPPTHPSSLDLHVSHKESAAPTGRVKFRQQSVLLNRDDITSFAGPRLPFQSRSRASSMADVDNDDCEPLFEEGDDEEEFLSRMTSDTHQRRVWWKYAGRAINEWELIVCSFEEYVRLRKEVDGVARIEDVGTPILLADIPAKVTSSQSIAD